MNPLTPVMIQVGSRQVAVRTDPLPDCPAASFRDKALVQCGRRLVVIRSSPGAWVFAAAFVLLPVFLICFVLYVSLSIGLADATPLAVLFVVGVPVLTTALALVLLWFGLRLLAHVGSYRVVLDADRNLFCKRGPRSQRRSFPLDRVLAVQVIAGGWHRTVSSGPPGGQGGRYYTYQLNLVVDAAEPRVNVSNHTDQNWTAESTRVLAAVLGVPLVMHVQPKEEACRDTED